MTPIKGRRMSGTTADSYALIQRLRKRCSDIVSFVTMLSNDIMHEVYVFDCKTKAFEVAINRILPKMMATARPPPDGQRYLSFPTAAAKFFDTVLRTPPHSDIRREDEDGMMHDVVQLVDLCWEKDEFFETSKVRSAAF